MTQQLWYAMDNSCSTTHIITHLSVYLHVSNDFSYGYIYDKNLADGNWHHALAQFDGTIFAVYVDGVLVHSDSGYGPGRSVYFESNGLNIGGMPMATDKSYYNGRLDELLLYNRALSPKEIELLASKVSFTQGSAPENGLLVYLPFQEDSRNASPNAVESTSIMVQRGSFATPCSGFDAALGKYMKLLNGTDEYLSGSETLQAPAFTLCFFLNTNSAEESFVAGWDTAGYKIVLNPKGNTGKLQCRLWVSQKETYSITSPALLNDGRCHQVALSYDSSFFRVYIDGVLAPEHGELGPNRPVFYEGRQFLVGHDPVDPRGRWLQGKVDEIRLYNRALSESEISGLRRSRDLPIEQVEKRMYGFLGGSGCSAYVRNQSSKQVTVDIQDKNTKPPSFAVKKQRLKPGEDFLKNLNGAPKDYEILVDEKN